MKRTILSSMLFLYPINIAYRNRDRWMLNLNVLTLSASLINHSHTFHGDRFRRYLFGWIDEKLVMFLTMNISLKCISKCPSRSCILHIGTIMGMITFIYFYLLGGLKRDTERTIESYNECQKYAHMAMHVIGILGLTRASELYYYK